MPSRTTSRARSESHQANVLRLRRAILQSQLPRASLKLPEKAKVVFDQHSDIGDGVFPHGNAVDAKSKGPAGILLAVEAMPFEYFQHVGMNHPATAQFDPLIF